MTKKEFNKYYKEVRDKYGKLIKVGDTVVFADSYYSDCHIGIVHHFTEETVIIRYHNRHWSICYKVQRMSDRIIKIADGCKDKTLVKTLDKLN